MAEIPPVWRRYDPIELDRQYDARASVPSFEAEYAHYVAASNAVLAAVPRRADLVYDPASGERLDLWVAGPGTPVFLWIHGGYWRALSKHDNAFVVPGLLAHGISVAVMDYSLAPAVGIEEIVRQTRAAAAWLHHQGADLDVDTAHLHIGGSSAGGHLVAMLLAAGWHDDFGIPEDLIGTALGLSGLYDLAPLVHTKVDGWMRFDRDRIAAVSPIGQVPRGSSARFLAAVGGRETDEFRRQTRDYLARWRDAGNAGAEIAMDEANHFDIALALGDPHGVLARTVAASILGAE